MKRGYVPILIWIFLRFSLQLVDGFLTWMLLMGSVGNSYRMGSFHPVKEVPKNVVNFNRISLQISRHWRRCSLRKRFVAWLTLTAPQLPPSPPQLPLSFIFLPWNINRFWRFLNDEQCMWELALPLPLLPSPFPLLFH